ncbi:hypothetical protein ACFL0K_00555 [Patescibacteria group bacterium]
MVLSNKTVTEQLEIYKQRYETFRHLDKLRWQMLQIAIATGSVILTFGKSDSTAEPGWWIWATVGMVLLILGFAMMRISNGIKKNGENLRRVGDIIGDVNIPKSSPGLSNISFWIETIMITMGLVCLILSIYYLTHTI